MNFPPRLKDAIFLIQDDPFTQHHWLKLMLELRSSYADHPPFELKEYILNEVPDEGLAGIHKDSFLGYVFNDPRFVRRLGNRLLESRRIQADRTMSYLNYEVATRAASSRNKQVFKESLYTAMVPELVTNLAKKLRGVIRRDDVRHRSRRVAVYASSICTANHPPTQLALAHVRLLAELGYEVVVFSVQEHHIDTPSLYFAHGGFCGDLPFNLNGFEKLIGNTKTSIYITDPKLSLLSRWQESFRSILAYEPEFILFVGCFSPMVEVLSDVYPILAINVFSMAPMVSCDTWLCADDTLNEDRKQLPDHPTLGLPYYYPHRVIAKQMTPLHEFSGLRFDQETLVLISIGARLDLEIEGEWAASMCQLLLEVPSIRWVLIGGEGKMPQALSHTTNNRILILPHVSEILTYLSAADIYVNPPRIGGGFSVADAMSVGLPVVSFRDCDGGCKIGDESVETQDAYFKKLSELIQSQTQRREIGEKLKNKFLAEICISNAAPALARAIEQCHSEFVGRTQKSQIRPVS